MDESGLDNVLGDVKNYVNWLLRMKQNYVGETHPSRLKEYCHGGMNAVLPCKPVVVLSAPVQTNDGTRVEQNSPKAPLVSPYMKKDIQPSVPLPLQPLPPELDNLRQEISACRRCSLGASRIQAVFGNGNPNANLVFIGEAPGANEDKNGIPFCGAAGNLLNKELEKNGVKRDDFFVVNCLKCRPPENRDPSAEELALCEDFLLRQLDILNPKMLCVLGRYAAGVLLKRPIAIMKERGTWAKYHNLPLFICLHPAAILHQPNNRQLLEADIKALIDAYKAAQG